MKLAGSFSQNSSEFNGTAFKIFFEIIFQKPVEDEKYQFTYHK